MCFFQAEDGIRDVERSRGLGDVYKRQILHSVLLAAVLCDNMLSKQDTLLQNFLNYR